MEYSFFHYLNKSLKLTQMKNIYTLLFLFFLVVLQIEGQAIKYDYDASGNRIKREKVIALKSAELNEEDEDDYEDAEDFYEDFFGERKVVIYPNPTKGVLRVDFQNYGNTDDMQLIIYDMQGKLLQQIINVSIQTILDLTSYPTGVYLLLLIEGDEKSQWKIVKE